jgi:hypothetical protein
MCDIVIIPMEKAIHVIIEMAGMRRRFKVHTID